MIRGTFFRPAVSCKLEQKKKKGRELLSPTISFFFFPSTSAVWDDLQGPGKVPRTGWKRTHTLPRGQQQGPGPQRPSGRGPPASLCRPELSCSGRSFSWEPGTRPHHPHGGFRLQGMNPMEKASVRLRSLPQWSESQCPPLPSSHSGLLPLSGRVGFLLVFQGRPSTSFQVPQTHPDGSLLRKTALQDTEPNKQNP